MSFHDALNVYYSFMQEGKDKKFLVAKLRQAQLPD